MHDNLNTILDSLKTNAIPAVTSTGSSYQVIDYQFVKYYIFRTLYSPRTDFPLLAAGLAGLMQGDASAIYEAYLALVGVLNPDASPSDSSDDEALLSLCLPPDENFHSGSEVQTAYICNDGRGQEKPISKEWAQQVLEKNQEKGSFGGVLAGFEIGCA
jgi:hypothetical protein